MSIEISIEKLADAINNLAGAYSGAVAALGDQGAAPGAEAPKPRRGRPPKGEQLEDPPESPVEEEKASLAERMKEKNSLAETPAIVDAGTGKPVEAPAAADRKTVKHKAGKLIATDGGDATLTDLLRKHSGKTEGDVKIGLVPDEALAALEADIDAALTLAD